MKKQAQERKTLDKIYQALNLKGKLSNKLDPQQKELFEIIRMMQEGSSNRFRYEINALGLRTIRLDNLYRTPLFFVSKEEILENGEMDVYTDKDTIAASIKVVYGSDYTKENRPYAIDVSKEDSVAQNIREKPQIEFETYLGTRALAITRTALEAGRLGQVRRFTDSTLRGKKYLFLRIYDMITVELIDTTREWAGTWNCQVLGIKPDTDKLNNKVKLLLVEKIADIDDGKTLRVTTDGSIRKTQSSSNYVRVTK